MGPEQSELLELQRQRRKRINKLKSLIIKVISFWMIFSLIAIVVLSVQVIRLSVRLNNLDAIYTKNEKLLMEMKNNLPDSQKPEPDTVVDSDSETDTFADSELSSEVQTGDSTDYVQSGDNMASEDDVHKVYLTFDCEPSQNTYLILKYLKENNIKATFFVSGDETDEGKAVCKKIVDDGHTIGMHSYSNRYSTVYASEESFKEDFDQIYNYILDVTGKESIYYRFPGGSNNEISNLPMSDFISILNDKNITYFDWNVSAGDSSAVYSVSDVVDNVTSGVSKYKTSVVLLHDYSNKSTTAEAIKPLISALNRMNAEVLPIDENTYIVQYNKSEDIE